LLPDACGDDAIIYVDSGPVTKRVMLLGTDGSRRPIVTIQHNETLSMPRCDPSGRHVVFVHGLAPYSDSGNDVYIADRAGVTTQLTTDHASSTAMFTADGRSIMFAASHGGKRDLFVMPAAGGAPRPLLVGDAGIASDVSRDGRFVVFHRSDTSTYPVIGEGNAARLITSRRGNYFWTRPAGTDLVVARRATGASSEIVTVRIRDGAINVLAPGFTGFPSLDNTRVYFRNFETSNVLMTVPIDGGPPTTVASLPGTIMSGVDGPDGPHLGVETRPGVVEAYRIVDGHVEAEHAPGLVTVAPSGGWRAVTVLFAKTGSEAPARLLVVPPDTPLSAPTRELAVSSVYNLWLDDHRIGYCAEGACHVMDVITGATEDVPVYPKFYEHGAIVTPDGKHIVDSLEVSRITRHVLANFDAWPR
jgi:Tol biopolymer transport system component